MDVPDNQAEPEPADAPPSTLELVDPTASDGSKLIYTLTPPDNKYHPNLLVKLVVVFILLAITAGGLYYYLQYYHRAKTVAAPVKRDIPLIRVGISDGDASDMFYPKSGSEAGDIEIQDQMFEGLIGYAGGTKLVPLLATSWSNPNDSTWDFTLRSDVKFHSGRTMTAADVKYSLDTFKDSAFSDFIDLGATIKAVTILAPNQVQIITNGPDPTLLGRLALLDIIDSHNSRPDDPINGTGPYTVKSGTDPAEDGVFDLVAVDNYWGGHVYTRELQFSFPNSQKAGADALENHRLDVYSNIDDVDALAGLRQAGLAVIPVADDDVGFFQLNTKLAGSPLANLKFRQGLALAINRQILINTQSIKGQPIDQLVPQSIPGYDPSITVPNQDTAQAKALIAASGITNPTITLTASETDAVTREMRREFTSVGVNLRVDTISNYGDFNAALTSGRTELAYYGTSSALFDGSDILETFEHSADYDDPTFDQDLTAADQTMSASKHIALLQQAARVLNADVAVIPISANDFYAGSALTGARLSSDVPGVDLGVYFWKVYRQ